MSLLPIMRRIWFPWVGRRMTRFETKPIGNLSSRDAWLSHWSDFKRHGTAEFQQSVLNCMIASGTNAANDSLYRCHKFDKPMTLTALFLCSSLPVRFRDNSRPKSIQELTSQWSWWSSITITFIAQTSSQFLLNVSFSSSLIHITSQSVKKWNFEILSGNGIIGYKSTNKIPKNGRNSAFDGTLTQEQLQAQKSYKRLVWEFNRFHIWLKLKLKSVYGRSEIEVWVHQRKHQSDGARCKSQVVAKYFECEKWQQVRSDAVVCERYDQYGEELVRSKETLDILQSKMEKTDGQKNLRCIDKGQLANGKPPILVPLGDVWIVWEQEDVLDVK